MNAPATTFLHRAQHRQRGSVLISAAIALSLLVIVLTGTELGYLFSLKRNFQKSADLAALAGAQALQPGNCGLARAAAIANAAQNLPTGFILAPADVSCGHWDPVLTPAAPHYDPAGAVLNAVQVRISRTPALLMPGIPGNQARQVAVQAVAAQQLPRAALTIRSTLATVDTARSALLNSIFSGFLGGNVVLDAVGWQGLANTNIKLFSYLDALALQMGLSAGQYDAVLTMQATVGNLIAAAVSVLEKDGTTAQATLDALNTLKLAANFPAALPLVRLGDVLHLQTGSSAAGLDVGVEVFQLVQGLVLKGATGSNALLATVPLSLPGVVNARARVQVIEAPQVSAVGDPSLAELDPLGANRIFVRSAQLRTFLSIELPALNGVSSLVTAVNNLLAPVTTLLNDVLSLNLVKVLSCVVSCVQTGTDIALPTAPLRLDFSLDAGGAQAHLTGYGCDGNDKIVDTQTTTSAARLLVGHIGAAGSTAAQAEAAAFSSSNVPAVTAIPVLDIGSVTKTCALLVLCSTVRHPFAGGGLGLRADVPLAGTTQAKTYTNTPTLDQPPAYQSVSSSNIINSLAATLNGVNLLQTIPPTTATTPSLLGTILPLLTTTLTSITNLLAGVASGLLSPLLDPLLNTLLRDVLGINLATTDVGARMTCTRGAQLVY